MSLFATWRATDSTSDLDGGRSQHRDKADEAWEAYQALVAAGHHAWAAVTLAYSALHHIDTYITERGMQVGSHGTRRRTIIYAPELRPIARNYAELHNYALEARYATGITYSAADIQLLERDYYAPIRTLILQLVR